MSSLTIAYITARRDPKINWWFDSLRIQLTDWEPKLIVVDLHQKSHAIMTDKHVPPKPNVWQGEHRLTKEDWFAPANARNTALCLCETEWIAYVDDLSVLMPEWLARVEAAMEGGYNVAGSYRKVQELLVEGGKIKWSIPFSDDSRLRLAKEDLGDCEGGWLYGCSCAFRVDDLLTVGGWPEYCDGMGSEDYCLGIALKNAGFPLKYDRKMMTLESEEDHHREPSLRRTDKGTSPFDKSHAALNIAKSSSYFANYYPGGMRALRAEILSGKPFPVIQEPKHDWFDGMEIAQM